MCVCVYIHLSIYLSIYLSISISIYLSIYLSIYKRRTSRRRASLLEPRLGAFSYAPGSTMSVSADASASVQSIIFHSGCFSAHVDRHSCNPLVLKAHRLLYHSTLVLRVMMKKKKDAFPHTSIATPANGPGGGLGFRGWGFGFWVLGFGFGVWGLGFRF